MLAITIGVIALNEKCRKIASCAKITPTIGALNPAEIAAATPQPINTSVENLFPVICLSILPKVAPKCTKGPY